MSLQITKRKLAAGLGFGTLALLTQTQRASSDDVNFSAFAFPATGAPTARTMPDRLADVVNVRDFGAVGNGTTDDRAAIQAAIDAAFGPSASPHGATATQNRALVFPNGNYLISSPLVLTRVRGACIRGAGQLTTLINGPNGCIITNGMDYCSFENLGFNVPSSGSGHVAFEMDWDGTGSVGLQSNIFTNCAFGGGDYACRIAISGYGGSSNQFFGCNFNNSTIAGLVTWSASATGQSVQGGGASQNATAFWVKAGQIATVNDVGLSGNNTQDILMDSVGPVLVKGCRSESPLFCKFNNASSVAMLDGDFTSASVREVCRTKGKVIMDSCSTDWTANTVFCSDPTFNGTVYIRACGFPQSNFLTGFTGTIAQRI